MVLLAATVTPDQAHVEALTFGFLLLLSLGLIAGLIFGRN
jgi:hypothetical protein